MAWDRRDTTAAAAIAALAFVLRLTTALLTEVIGADAAAYLFGAQEIARGDWATSLDLGIHPAYPFAIALAGGGETPAYLVSVLFSSLAMVPLYALVRDMAGRRVAILSTLFFACVPYFILEHADIMTDGLFHFLFVSSATCTWFGVTRGKPAAFLGAGAAGGLAYLTRPEGVYAAVALVGLTAIALAVARPRPWRHAAWMAAGVAVFLALAFPLLDWFRQRTGAWTLSRRESVELAMAAASLPVEKTEWSQNRKPAEWQAVLGRLAKHALQLSFFLAPVALLALFFRRMRPLGAVYLACLAVGYALPPILAARAGYALSHRQLLLPLLFLIPFGAMGCVGLVDRIGRRGARVAASVALGALLAAISIQAVHPRRVEEVSIRDAALWLRGRVPSAVYANTSQAGWYVGARTRVLPQTLDGLRQLRIGEGEYLFVVKRDVRKRIPGGLEFLDSRHRCAARFGGDDSWSVVVYAP